MPDPTAVDRMYEESAAITAALQATAEISLQVSAADNFRKALLLAAASYFEVRVSACVLDFVHERSSGSLLVASFVRNAAMERHYHSWFEWKGNNVNKFFALFGSEFRVAMSKRVEESEDLRLSARAFLEIGSERNKLVHQDYATFPMEKTLEEIYQLYKQAIVFVEFLPVALRESDASATKPR